jgi:hypothetical protein
MLSCGKRIKKGTAMTKQELLDNEEFQKAPDDAEIGKNYTRCKPCHLEHKKLAVSTEREAPWINL